MSQNSIPRPSSLPDAPPGYDSPPRAIKFSTVYPPPTSALPQTFLPLPSAQRKPIWFDDARIPYSLTTHIVPAAFLREDPDVTLPEAPKHDGSLTKEERRERVRESEARLRELRREAEDEIKSGKKRGQEKVLWICLNRYVRSNSVKGGLTLFCAHANGMHKETWEPMLLSLLSSPRSQAQIQEIWAWDAVNHGDSALLNLGKLKSLSHWRSITRDLLTFLIYYLPSSPEVLPTHLPRLSQSEVDHRIRHGFLSPSSSRPPIIGIGHSFGGCISTLAALAHPSLFSSLALIDPVILYPKPNVYHHPISLAVGAVGRRGSWSSREEAKKGFLSSPFFKVWDECVLELYIEHALYEDRGADTSAGTGIIRLKMPPMVEAAMFTDTETGSVEAWVRLRKGELDERIGLKWIMPDTPLDPRPGATETRVWLRPENASNVRLQAGHLIVQERPDVLGKEIGIFLDGVAGNKAKL